MVVIAMMSLSAESLLSCSLSSRQWTYSKEKLIDKSSRNSSKDWSRPVHLCTSLTFGNQVNLILDAHPVVVPEAHHCIGPEGTGRVHAAASLIWRWTLWDDSNPVRGTKYFFLKMVFVRWFKPGPSERDQVFLFKDNVNLDPVRGMAKRWQVVMDSPIARGAEPCGKYLIEIREFKKC